MSSPTLSFNGSSDDVQTEFPANFGTGDFAVCAKVYFNDTSNHTIVGSTFDGLLLDITSNGDYRFYTDGEPVRGGSVETNTWHRVFGQRRVDGDLELYIDGELLTTASSSNTDVSSPTNIYIGQRGNGNSYLYGMVDDVRFYPYSLQADNIRAVADGIVRGDEEVLWSMNEGQGTTVTDASSNNYSGTIRGATWSSRSSGNTYRWYDDTDWDAAQDQDDVDHDLGTGGTGGADILYIGQPSDQLTTTSEESYYVPDNVTGTVFDRSPANNDPVTTNNVTVLDESNRRFTGSADFNGADSYVELPTAVFSSANFLSFETWLYPRRSSSGAEFPIDFHKMFSLDWNGTQSQGFGLRIYGDNSPLGPSGLSLNAWHHVNCYWDVGTEFGMSVNGGSWDTYATTNGIGSRNAIRSLGAKKATNANWFDGKMGPTRFVVGQKIPTNKSLYQKTGYLLTARKV